MSDTEPGAAQEQEPVGGESAGSRLDEPEPTTPETEEELAAELTRAAAAGQTVLPRGAGTRDGLGALGPPPDRVLSTTGLDEIVFYEPGDLTISVQAGLPLSELDDRLAEHGQWLPHQPYRRSGTVGGLVASAADGLLDGSVGRIRDAVLGARFALTDGTLARARGRVVKNVAGYDIPRLLVGSLGTLAVLVEVSLRLVPRPERELTLVLGTADPASARRLAARLLEPPLELASLDVLCGACSSQVVVGLDGREARVEGQRQRVLERATGQQSTGELVLEGDESRALRARLDDPVASMALLDRAPPPAGAATCALLRWAGLPTQLDDWIESVLAASSEARVAARADLRPAQGLGLVALSAVEPDELVRFASRVAGEGRRTGAVTLLSAPPALRRTPDDVWGPPAGDLVLMNRVKRTLDPAGVLAPGRFVGGL